MRPHKKVKVEKRETDVVVDSAGGITSVESSKLSTCHDSKKEGECGLVGKEEGEEGEEGDEEDSNADEEVAWAREEHSVPKVGTSVPRPDGASQEELMVLGKQVNIDISYVITSTTRSLLIFHYSTYYLHLGKTYS